MLTFKTCTQSFHEARNLWVNTPSDNYCPHSHACRLRVQNGRSVATSYQGKNCQVSGGQRSPKLCLHPTLHLDLSFGEQANVLATCQLLFANSFALWFYSLVCNFPLSAIWSPHAFLLFQWGIVQRPMPAASTTSSRNHARDLRGACTGFPAANRSLTLDLWPRPLYNVVSRF